MALDFDPAIVALASQPFCLVWPDGERDREYTPDHLARLADGTGVDELPCEPRARLTEHNSG